VNCAREGIWICAGLSQQKRTDSDGSMLRDAIRRRKDICSLSDSTSTEGKKDQKGNEGIPGL
jgi:hypothetical protein